MLTLRTSLIPALLIVGVLTRIFPHWPNFTAVGAIAIFGAAAYRNRWWAYLMPLAILLLSDLWINNVIYGAHYEGFQWFTPGFIFIYGGFLATAILARKYVRNYRIGPILGMSLGSALIFFLLTNFGVWLSAGMYPLNLSGLLMAYAAGLPFLATMAAANVFYGALFFGAAYVLQPQMRLTPTSHS